MATTKPKNEQEAKAMREAADAFFAEQAQERATAYRGRLEPLHAFVSSPEFQAVIDGSQEHVAAFADIDAIDVHLRPLAGFLTRLRAAVEREMPAEGPPPPPAPAE